MVLKILYFLLFSFLSIALPAQGTKNETFQTVITDYETFMKKGRFKDAINCLDSLLKSKSQLSSKEKLVLNNNLGIAHKNLGEYDVALEYYTAAESVYFTDTVPNHTMLVSIYGNLSNIYTIKGDFNKAMEFCQKAIRSIPESSWDELQKQKTTSALYLSSGIIYLKLNKFNEALSAFKTSLLLKDKYALSGKDILYKQLANAYAKMGANPMADKYYNLSISQSESEKRNYGYNLVNTYLEYGHFLYNINENNKAVNQIQKALNISLINIGPKNQLTSNCYQMLGDYFRFIKNYSKALSYYQKTLVSGTKDFDDLRIEANPSRNAITVNLWQLRVLQVKASALAQLAEQEPDQDKRINDLVISLNTNNIAIEMVNQIRVDYQDEKTRLVFNEKQKNIFIESLETALKLYNLTNEKRYLQMAYQIAQQSKANELKYEIARNKSFSTKEVSDTLRNAEKNIQNKLSALNVLIRNERAILTPDTVKLSYWRDQQFNLNRALEKNGEAIERSFPRFTDKLKKGNILEFKTIQANLEPDESLIEYIYSEAGDTGGRNLYEFVITPKDLFFHTEYVDSTMTADLSALRAELTNRYNEERGIDNYNKLNHRLFKAYTVLIQPLEKYFKGKQLVIIPDEGLSSLPFDAFLTSWVKKTKINYAELSYLIRNYSISYGYSTSTLWNSHSNAQYWPKVIGFAPEYANSKSDDTETYKSLKNNNLEIKNILDNFDGISVNGSQATRSNFLTTLTRGTILHLAMHAELDTINTGSSSLIFTRDNSSGGNYHLHNYEIGQMNIQSPMVVLSACNTGNGKLYSGEGLMSLARSFILAGVPSVVETLWPVEDISGSKIMGDFYKYLSLGEPKNKAMRMAKLDYINTTSPSFVNPRFWAAYTIVGDVSAIKKFWWKEPWILLPIALIVLTLIAFLIYLVRFLRIR